MLFHINPSSGRPGPCRAASGACPFGGAEAHYSTEEKARQAYELSMASETLPPAARPAYPVPGDEVTVHARAGLFDAQLDGLAGARGVVEEFSGTYYHVRLESGEVVKLHHQIVVAAAPPPSKPAVARVPVPPARPSYPVEGDSVQVHPQAGIFDSTLENLAGARGVVEEFTGTYYHVKLDSGKTVKLPHQAVLGL